MVAQEVEKPKESVAKNEHHLGFKVAPENLWKLQDFRLDSIRNAERIIDFDIVNSNQVVAVNKSGAI
jgi:hypothetical protein